MKSTEEQIRDAFDNVTLPPSVRENTLAAIAALEEESGRNPEVAPGTAAPVVVGDSVAVSEPATVESAPATAAAIPATIEASTAPKAKVTVISHAKRKIFAVAACLVLCVLGLGGFSGFAAETAQVDIDINPSLELGVNAFDRVVAVRPLNDDAETLVQGVNLWGKTYDEAMAILSEQEAFDTYVTQDSYVQISVVCDDGNQQQSLTDSSQAYLQSLPCEGSCDSATKQQHQEARDAGMGVGRYEAAQQLMALDSSVELDDCKDMTMRQLRDAIEQHHAGDSDNLGHQQQKQQHSHAGNAGGSGNASASGNAGGSGNAGAGADE